VGLVWVGSLEFGALKAPGSYHRTALFVALFFLVSSSDIRSPYLREGGGSERERSQAMADGGYYLDMVCLEAGILPAASLSTQCRFCSS